MTLPNRTNKIIFWSIFAFVSACFSFIFMEMPRAHDDWWYLGDILYSGFDENGHHTLFLGIKECLKYHFNIDNSRLCNIVGTFFLVIPKWITSPFISITFILGYWLMTKVSGIKPGMVLPFLSMTFLYLFNTIWHDHMFTQIFAFNYVVGLPLFLFAIIIFFRNKPFKIWQAVFLGLFVGLWHESFGGTLVLGGALTYILYPSMRKKWRLLMLISAFAGIVWQFLLPGQYNRVEHIVSFSYIHYKLFIFIIPLIIYILLYILCLSSKKYKFLVRKPLYPFVLVCCLFSFPVVNFTYIPRAVFPVSVMTICALTHFFVPFFNRLKIKSHNIYIVLCIIFLTCIATNLISACIDTIRVKTSVNSLLVAAAKTRDYSKGLFFQTHFPPDLLPTSLQLPDFSFFEYGEHIRGYLNYPQHIILIPDTLRYYSKGNGEVIDSNSSIRRFNGYFISEDTTDIYLKNGLIKYNSFSEYRKVVTNPFIGADGNKYVYIMPLPSRLGMFMGEIIDFQKITVDEKGK